MIHILLGTKAQLIKMAPVMVRLRERGVPYRFVSTGQHRDTMEDILANFALPPPDFRLREAEEVSTIQAMGRWALSTLHSAARRGRDIFAGDRRGIVLVHGDTASTLLGAFLGRVAGLAVGHVEAGLRSHNMLHPFPEEAIRLAVFRLSDILFCPGDWAVANVRSLGKVVVDTGANTLVDAAALAVRAGLCVENAPQPPYAVMSVHRYENLATRQALRRIVGFASQLAERLPLVFVLHPATRGRLERTGMLDELRANPRVDLRERLDYFRFIALLRSAEFVATDGGSIQEESSYLGLPCLILRKATERREGLGSTAVLSEYKQERVVDFLDRYRALRVTASGAEFSVSDRIIDAVVQFAS